MTAAHPLSQPFVDRLRAAGRVRIGTHLNPDGDAIGSALALMHALDGLEVPCEPLCAHPAPWNLRFLPGVERLREAPTEEADLGVLVDLDSLDRLGCCRAYFESIPELIVVDHHLPHEAPGSLRVIETSYPATALILAELLMGAGVKITPNVAICLLTGIVTDTGSFRYRNTTPGALAMASELQALGGDLVRVCEEVYQRRPLQAVRLLGRALDRMKLASDARVAWSTLRTEDFASLGAIEAHSEGIVNELLFIESVQVAALIREAELGKVRASLRSRDHFDVNEVARRFGGGGHVNAAGCNFAVPLDEAEGLLGAALRDAVEGAR